MMCDVCGRETVEFYDVQLEGSRMRVCRGCSKYGKVIREWKPPVEKQVSIARAPRPKEAEDVLLAGYGELIKKAREKRGLTREEFGLMINERESILKRVEQENMQPTDAVLKKIEEHLKLTLKARPVDVIRTDNRNTNTLMLGDIVRIKKRK